MSERLCQGPNCHRGPDGGRASLEGSAPQRKTCGGACRKALERERAGAPGAEVLLQREKLALAFVFDESAPEAGLDARDALHAVALNRHLSAEEREASIKKWGPWVRQVKKSWGMAA